MQAAEDAGEKKKKADEEAHVSIQWQGEEAIMERVAALKERWAAGAKLVGQTWEQGVAARKLQHNAHVKEKVEKLAAYHSTYDEDFFQKVRSRGEEGRRARGRCCTASGVSGAGCAGGRDTVHAVGSWEPMV